MSKISEMPGASGQTPGNTYGSDFREGSSPSGDLRKFGNLRIVLSRMGVYT